ncbi:MAG: hypothetical protein IJ880_00065 [Bacilli bacterium]|nr:hypothetical protein [Bacilli bacterium]
MKKFKNKVLQWLSYILGLFQIALIYLLLRSYINILMFIVLSITTEVIIFALICYGFKSLFTYIINSIKKVYLYIRVKDVKLRQFLMKQFGLLKEIKNETV